MKIVIVGGGVAGSIAALKLSPLFDVTLIQEKIWDKPCGGGVKTKIFSQFNLDSSFIKHKISNVFIKYKNKSIKVDLHGENLSIVFRKEFDNYLRELAKKNGTKLVYDRVKDLNKNKVFTKEKEFDFDILIAADGVNSTIRKKLSLQEIPFTITHYSKANLEVENCEFFFDKEVANDYYAWVFPHLNKAHIGTTKRKNFINLLKKLNIETEIKGYKIPTWQEDIEIQKNNIYFVGDAAGQVMPLTFEGIYYAMHSANILANSIIKNLDYKTEWNKRFLKEFKFMKRLEKINKTNLRPIMIYLQNFKFIRDFSVKLWLGEKNV